jgi:hypothetical protein
MKSSLVKIGSILSASIFAAWGVAFAQVEVRETTTSSAGTITEFTPGSQTLIMRSESSPDPLRYVITRETNVVDETGAPVVMEKVTRGVPVNVEYIRTGDRLVASRIVVHRTAVAPVAPVERTKTTTTTTTVTDDRKLTHDEKERLEKEREAREEIREADKERQEKVDEAVKKLRERD